MPAIKLTDGTRNALDILKANDASTLSELNEVSETNIASAHLTSLIRNGLAEAVKVEVPVTRMVEINSYKLTDAGRNFSDE